jgi:hypothetical protein
MSKKIVASGLEVSEDKGDYFLEQPFVIRRDTN